MNLKFVVFLSVLSCCYAYAGDETDKTTGCPVRFKEKCNCGLGSYRQMFPDRKVYITNCTNTGFDDPSVLEFVPSDTEVLIFNGNRFPTLPWNLLGIWKDFPNLTVIDLSNNGIKEIPGKALHKVNSVKRLILNHNDLYIVSGMDHPRMFSNLINLEELHLTNAFTEQVVAQWYLLNLQNIFISSNMKKLRKLHLEQNEIWRISNPEIFCPLTNLMDLHLSDNQLTDINFTLSCLPKLRYLDLEYNKMTNLHQPTISLIESLFGDKEKDRTINIKAELNKYFKILNF
jgi:Leucine-rich repeat (LRR) protein